MRSIDRAPGVHVGERVWFRSADDDEHWQEGVVHQILRYHDEFLLEIKSFTPQSYYVWISDVEKGPMHES